MNEQTMTNDDDLIELGCGGSFTMTTRVLTSVNVERIKGALASTIHEMPLGLTREERRAFILAAAKSDVQTWAEEKSQAVKSAARAHQPSVDARKAFGFAPMSLKGVDYSWPGQQEDEPRYCEACNGMGWTWEEKQVGERKSDVQTISVHCDKCEGTGYET